MNWLDEVRQTLAGFMRPTAPATPPMEPPNSTGWQPVPYYPAMKYVDKGWPAEQKLTQEGLSSIAAARRQAEAGGVLSPELGDMLLPIAMTEGWGQGMGVKDTNAFYASPRFKESLRVMKLEEGRDYQTTYVKGAKHFIPMPTDENGPRLAAAILGEKAKLKGVKTVEDAIKRYNGKGKATEDYYGETVPADVNVYWKKVSEAKKMLAHPHNAALVKHYDTAYKSGD